MNKECFDKIPKIETERLIIRAFNETDFQEYVTWHCGDIL